MDDGRLDDVGVLDILDISDSKDNRKDYNNKNPTTSCNTSYNMMNNNMDNPILVQHSFRKDILFRSRH